MLRFPDRDSAVKGVYYKGDLTWDEIHNISKPVEEDTVGLDEREKYIRHFNNIVRLYDEWFQQIKDKADERGISVDSMIRKDAIWLYEKEQLEKQNAKHDTNTTKP